jgi:carboxypeptidase C (cathepsin A)
MSLSEVTPMEKNPPAAENASTTETAAKKDYRLPDGARHQLSWEAAPGAPPLTVHVLSEWICLRKKERPAAEIFHTYYHLDEKSKAGRPVTFVFNGGPGAASAYLHVGGLGPRRIHFEADGRAAPPPTRLVNNTESWIEFTDLVFVDPVGTGFSRVIDGDPAGEKTPADAAKKVDEKEFYGLNRDLESLGEFIERFLSKHNLWDRPVFIAGESYGGFRTAKLARRLQEKHGVGLSGAIAISPALEFSMLNESDYDVLRYMDTFCAMALAAAHHGRSRVFTGNPPVETIRGAIEAFATRELAHAFVVGTGHDQTELTKVYDRAADFLGLPREMVRRAEGRVPFWRFARELLRDQRRVVGFYDATISAVDPFPDREMNEGADPTLTGIEPVFTAGINHLLRTQIGVQSERRYELLSHEVNGLWKRDDQKHVLEGPAGATDDLRYAISLNPHMKVLITHGYYDLVTPYFSSERLVEHMKLLPEQRRALATRHFSGGHMFYTWEESRRAFRDWVRATAYGYGPATPS